MTWERNSTGVMSQTSGDFAVPPRSRSDGSSLAKIRLVQGKSFAFWSLFLYEKERVAIVT